MAKPARGYPCLGAEAAVAAGVDARGDADGPIGRGIFGHRPMVVERAEYDLHACSDDNVVAVLRGSELWNGDLYPAPETLWAGFELLVQTGEGIAEGGQSLIVLAEGKDKCLRIRVFDAAGTKVVDTDETRLKARPDLPALKLEMDRLVKLKGTGTKPTAVDQEKVINIVRAVVGSSWRWTRMEGKGVTFIKQKHDSFNYCRRLIEAGKNWRVDALPPEAAGDA